MSHTHEIVPVGGASVASHQGGTMLEHVDADAANYAMTAGSAPGQNISGYLHALRRHWFVAAILGLICAVAAGAAAYIGYGARFESTAYLRVAAQPEYVAFPGGNHGDPIREFEIYKDTQLNLMLSKYVLSRALKRDAVAQLHLEQRERDPVNWLSRELIVRFPGRAELMEVSLQSPSPQEAKILVESVVQTYLDDYVNAEDERRRQRLAELEVAYTKNETDVRDARQSLSRLAEQLGTTDKEALSIQQQMVMQQFSDFQRELTRVQFELRRAKGELDGAQALLDSLADMSISPFEIDSEVRSDPVYRTFAEELAWRKMDLAASEGAFAQNAHSTHIDRYRADLQRVQEQYEALQNQFREGLRSKRRTEIEKELHEKQVEVAVLAAQEQELTKQVAKQAENVERVSKSSVDLEMLRSKVAQADAVLMSIAEEKEKLKVEQNSPKRIMQIQPAQVPIAENMPEVRYALSGMAAVLGLCLPVALIVLGDSRRRRLNKSDDILRGLGIPVIGSMPIVPPRVVRRLAAPGRAGESWRVRMSESVDGAMAHLLREAVDATRVVLVTSAVGGEGKTTLATQLAMSLARNGRRTVLVDFNLRRPALDRVFGLPQEPGVADALRGDGAVKNYVHQRSSDEPAIVTAGRWDRAALAALAQGGARTVFKQLRDQFEFVIVDSSPVLPVADTRFVSQHVDVVLLSTFRDVSRLPQIEAARNILEAFGVEKIEAVMTGAADHLHDRDIGLDAQLKTA